MADIDRDEIEEIVENKVKEIVEEKQGQCGMRLDEEEVADKIADNIKKNSGSQKEKLAISRGLSGDISRRKFLKLIGLGGLGLASSSTAASASWAQIKASSRGKSQVDARKINGHEISVGSTKPGSPSSGEIFYDTDGDGVHYYDGSSWVQIAIGSVTVDILVNGSQQDSFTQTSDRADYDVSVSEVTDDFVTVMITAWDDDGTANSSTGYEVVDSNGNQLTTGTAYDDSLSVENFRNVSEPLDVNKTTTGLALKWDTTSVTEGNGISVDGVTKS